MSRLSRPARPASLALWPAAFGFGLLSLLIAHSHPGATFGGASWSAALVELGVGWAMIAAGLYVWRRRPENRSGPLLAAGGVAWFFPEWNNPGVGVAVAFTFGLIVYALAPAVVAHAVIVYPSGRLASALERPAIIVAYAQAAILVGFLPTLFFDPARQQCSLCPSNLLLVHAQPSLVESMNRWGVRLGLVWTIGIAALCVWRLVRSSAPLRRVTTPVLVGGIGYLSLVWWDLVHSLPAGVLGNDQFESRLRLGQAGALCAVAAGVAWSWLLARQTRSAMATLVVELGQSPPPGGLREVLARSLGDPDLAVAYPLREPGRFADATGTAVAPAAHKDRAVTLLARQGQTVALLLHRPGLLDDPAVVDEVVAATRLALENERLQAEVLAQLEDLKASRARIVATGDAERRRLERDLHDGAQQRLVGLSLALGLARVQLGPDPDPKVTAGIDRAERELWMAIDELRELAQGIYPAVLTDEGLAAAVEALAERTLLPISITWIPEERFPSPVETAAYFLIAEVTGPIATLIAASGATVDVRRDGSWLVVELTEDGLCDTEPELQARFTELADRVGALEGRLGVEHVPERGITIRAEIPCGS